MAKNAEGNERLEQAPTDQNENYSPGEDLVKVKEETPIITKRAPLPPSSKKKSPLSSTEKVRLSNMPSLYQGSGLASYL